MQKEDIYIEQLTSAMNNANPVLTFDDAFKGIPYDKISDRPNGLPYSIWELSQHLRIAQHTYLHTGKDENFKAPKWPDEFWPKEKHPSEKEWEECLKAIHSDREELLALIREKKSTLAEPLAHAKGRSLFDLALAAARHSSYHTGEIVVLRRLLGIWKTN